MTKKHVKNQISKNPSLEIMKKGKIQKIVVMAKVKDGCQYSPKVLVFGHCITWEAH